MGGGMVSVVLEMGVSGLKCCRHHLMPAMVTEGLPSAQVPFLALRPLGRSTTLEAGALITTDPLSSKHSLLCLLSVSSLEQMIFTQKVMFSWETFWTPGRIRRDCGLQWASSLELPGRTVKGLWAPEHLLNSQAGLWRDWLQTEL